MAWLNYLQDTVFFVFYDILLLADYFVCLPFSRQSPLPPFSTNLYLLGLYAMLGPR